MKYHFNLTRYFIVLNRNAAVFLLCAGISPLTKAATTVTVSVTVLETPACVINDNRTIEVDFGEILTGGVNGSNYMKDVDYSLACSDDKSNAMRMKVQGNATPFDASALQTNISDFGVALRANGQALNVNSWLKFTYPDKPQLQAVPVKRAGKKLPGGAFTAGATLLVFYQ
ncbi:putative minor fimbrial subunit StfF [Serratia entomophila]|uniref:fimbrial protein n=1 Tax=Serratia entomophila TaxID=42906 RepID=UPI001F203863|nr:fimbrial protein [Serratia entomophila]UIW18644.1 fimbrial protein [Serratia entomophila]CAI0818572.1 putative minor fimbrial subunit StfF [Serratia entomophila]CAI0836510.1 putative minor fimbrial subunit StfF [Serratia entomophila]CAI0836919.1 putative minor fimbrial subunit StfF [Serratia entomophila]CAI0879433.1 putative minor fimbrial subunit StfF [Serratia entomophila]